MHAISSASPSHVRNAGGECFDVVAWAMLDDRPTAVIIRDGHPRYVINRDWTHHYGPAPKADA